MRTTLVLLVVVVVVIIVVVGVVVAVVVGVVVVVALVVVVEVNTPQKALNDKMCFHEIMDLRWQKPSHCQVFDET